jgi:hypothetical protein
MKNYLVLARSIMARLMDVKQVVNVGQILPIKLLDTAQQM